MDGTIQAQHVCKQRFAIKVLTQDGPLGLGFVNFT
jgi:hypothetical protein